MDRIPHLRVILAAIVFFAIGAAWYSALADAWLAGIGKSAAQIESENGGRPWPYVVGFAAILVMCYTLAWLLSRLGASTWRSGAATGAGVALGLVGGMLALNYAFESRSIVLWAINAGYALIGLVVAGGIIGARRGA